MNSKGGSRLLRKARVSLVGHAYHITMVTKNRTRVFQDFKMARHFIRILKESDDAGKTETLAFCIMPDHIHWLFIIKTDNLAKTVARVKSQYSRESKSKIWQDGFYDQQIRNNANLQKVARYIVANPLRANLVSHIADYPHWDAAWL